MEHTTFSERVSRRAIIYFKLLTIVVLFEFLQVDYRSLTNASKIPLSEQPLSVPAEMPMSYKYNHTDYKNDGQYIKKKHNYSTGSNSIRENAITVETDKYYADLNSILEKSKKNYLFNIHGGLENETVR